VGIESRHPLDAAARASRFSTSEKPNKPTKLKPDEQSDDYQNLVNLLSVFSDAKARIAALESDTNAAFLELVDERKKEYAELQKALTESEAALKVIAKMHPEWFEKIKTLKTPYGEVASRKTTTHEAPDEGKSIELIEAAAVVADSAGLFEEAELLRSMVKIEKSLDLDIIGKAPADMLPRLRILRIEQESVTIKEAKVSLGQAVRASDKAADKAAKKGKAAA
jgi:hypothetical protein